MRSIRKLFIVLGVLFFTSIGCWASDQIVKFAWDRCTQPEVIGYQMYRSKTDESNYVKIGDVIPQTVEGVEPGAEDTVPYIPGEKYFYTVTARSDVLESGKSNSVAAVSLEKPALRVVLSVVVEVNP